MKRMKLVASILTILALVLCAWSIYGLSSADGNLVSASLNLIYFLSLFVSFLCVRISMGATQRFELIPTIVAVAVICLSTYTWIASSELIVTGKYTLGLLPILIGTTLMLLVKDASKWSKIVQVGIGLIALSISFCVFSGAFGTSIYQILFIGMIAITLAVLGYSLFAKTT